MKISYYPGCTLKATARNLEDSAIASLSTLGIDVEELERWNCCGAVFTEASGDMVHQLAPVRVLIRAQEAGADQVVTLCSQCYNTLARANERFREDEETRTTVNAFMTEEVDYEGKVEVVHYLELLRDQIGWEKLRGMVKKPLTGLKVAPFYGCTLLRPVEISIDGPGKPTILKDFIAALGAEPVDFPLAEECCSAYQVLGEPEGSLLRSAKVVASALGQGVDALILSCPLCEYNLGRRQESFVREDGSTLSLPVFYFSQLLALALDLEPESCRFDLNTEGARSLLRSRKLVTAGA